MTSTVPPRPDRYTIEEHFRLDEAVEHRVDYIDSQVFDLADDTYQHCLISTNVQGLIWYQLRGRSCQGRGGKLRIRYGRRRQYGYPDALIVCGHPEFDPLGTPETTLLNPRVLIEVLSDSTEAYDRGLKFERYRDIESFEEYVLIAQDRPSVEVYKKQAGGLWTIQPSFQGLDAVARIEAAEVDLPLSEVYAGIEFPPEKPEPAESTRPSDQERALH